MLNNNRLLNVTLVISVLAAGGETFDEVASEVASSNVTKQENSNQNKERAPQFKICLTSGCNRTASSVLAKMDKSVEPCDDFYKYACGKFLKETTVPDDRGQVDTIHSAADHLHEQLNVTFKMDSAPNDPRAFKLVKILYDSCMNESSIEQQGLKPLRRIVEELGGWPVMYGRRWTDKSFSWEKLVYRARRKGYSPGAFISFFVAADPENNTKHIIYLDSPPLSLSRKYLIQGKNEEHVREYMNYMVDVALMFGLSKGINKTRVQAELLGTLQFEMDLANISLPEEERLNETALYNRKTVRELMVEHPSIPWLDYINTILAPCVTITEDEPVNVVVPSYIAKFEKLLNKTSNRTLANYAVWRAVSESVPYLNSQIRERELAFSKVTTGKVTRKPRWEECASVVSHQLSISVGSLFIRHHFNKNIKQSAEKMVSDITKEFIGILEEVDWMDEETRSAAIAKAKAMIARVAYPDELLNDTLINNYYSRVKLVRGNYLHNALSVELFRWESHFDELRKPVQKNYWVHYGHVAEVNPSYNDQRNALVLPAGILQGSFFSADRPNYMNYGAMGSIIGHEITHGFDDIGSQFDKEGNAKDWWKDATKTEFLNKVQCIIDQANNYTVSEVGRKLDGVNTQGENVADNGGVKVAYRAYNAMESREGVEPRLPGLQEFSPQQMFWISNAQIWCAQYKPEELNDRITTDSHGPSEFRINGVLSNLAGFAKDFKCSSNHTMNPVNKCIVW